MGQASPIPSSINSSRLSVLIVDGYDNDRQYYAHRLKVSSPDYDITEAADGKSALTLCQSHSFDCIILELDLPDTSGFEILLRLVQTPATPEVPVIVLTRLYYEPLHQLAKRNGAVASLNKAGTSGDVLDQVVFKTVGRLKKEKPLRRTDNFGLTDSQLGYGGK